MEKKKTEKKATSAKKTAPTAGPISKDMLIGEVVQKWPESAMVMMKFGMHCIGCHVSTMESIGDGAMGHGLSDEEIDKMIDEMNKIAAKSK